MRFNSAFKGLIYLVHNLHSAVKMLEREKKEKRKHEEKNKMRVTGNKMSKSN
jgi:hypothetical protein